MVARSVVDGVAVPRIADVLNVCDAVTVVIVETVDNMLVTVLDSVVKS